MDGPGGGNGSGQGGSYGGSGGRVDCPDEMFSNYAYEVRYPTSLPVECGVDEWGMSLTIPFCYFRLAVLMC